MTLSYDVHFDNDTQSNSKGFAISWQDAKDYIEKFNGTNESYFADYKGGTVSIVCNQTNEIVYSKIIN